MAPPPILVTGFVADQPQEGSTFPSAGGKSSDPKVQAVYWRCIAVLFASARINNSDARLVLCSNITPPTVSGVDMVQALDDIGVEIRHVPLTHRLPAERTPSWGNVLYFLDIMASFASEPDDQPVFLLDGDMVVTQPLNAVFALLDHADFAGYRVATEIGEAVNGMTRRQMGAAKQEFFGERSTAEVQHFGGEFFAMRMGVWRRHAEVFEALFDRSLAGEGQFANATTEEHLYSIAFGGLGVPVAPANAVMKRIWTSPRFSNVEPGDEALPLWHLPAEKRYGLTDLFADLAKQGFSDLPNHQDFYQLALKRAGIPQKSAHKWLFDGIRQLSSKLRGAL